MSSIMFKKESILRSKRYADVKEVLNVLLNNGTEYSLEEVDDVLKTFRECTIGKVSDVK